MVLFTHLVSFVTQAQFSKVKGFNYYKTIEGILTKFIYASRSRDKDR